MRTLAGKLTLAFLTVGIIGAVLVAVIVALRTKQAFDRFIDARDVEGIVSELSEYYAAQGSWAGVDSLLRPGEPLADLRNRLTVLNADQEIVYGRPSRPLGRPGNRDLNRAFPITVDGRLVGTLLLELNRPNFNLIPPAQPSPEDAFLRNVILASAISALIAALIALVLGGFLARNLTRPLRELTAVTQSMADGQLGQQVDVRSQDEIGELAASFNRMSADLAQASQQRKQMTADIAHDLRTPLTVLRGYTEGLKAGTLPGDEKLYDVMHEEVVHLQHLVEDLRTLSLVDAGELRLNKRAVDPRALLERTGLAYVMEAEKKGVSLRIEAPDNLPSVSVDLERMTQVLNNLVANALHYTNEGEIVLSAEAEGNNVTLQVKDTGVGIAAEELPFIFNRFFRTDKSRYRHSDGSSGLGLAIAKAIVQAHNGRIQASSTVGAGTTFTIHLPL